MSSKGFTLIELLVSIVISGVLLALGITAYNNFSENQKLELAVKRIKTDLRAIQAKAVANKQPSLCMDFQGYSVTFRDNDYLVAAECAGGTVDETAFSLPKDIVLKKADPTAKILFKKLSLGTDLEEKKEMTLTYRNEKTKKTAAVTIGPAGEIR